MRSQCHRDSTRRTYYNVWRSFNKFYIRLDIKPDNWEDRLTLFIGHLIDTNCKLATVRSYISAIKAVLHEVKVQLNEDRLLLGALTRACKLKNDRLQTRLPIHKSLLCVLLQAMDDIFESPQPYLNKLYSALLVTAYYGLFRISELTLSHHVLKAKDTYVGENKDKLKFVLYTSKTHGLGDMPQIIKINSMPAENKAVKKKHNSVMQNFINHLCPFQTIKSYIAVRGKYDSDNEQFFIFQDKSPVKPKHVRTILKRLFLHNKLNPKWYGTHGFRAGRSIYLLNMGVPVDTIKKLGCWKSSAVYKYFKC